MTARLLLCAALSAALASSVGLAPAAQAATSTGRFPAVPPTGATFTVQTVPPLPGVRFVYAGRVYHSDAHGVARMPVPSGPKSLKVLDPGRLAHGVRATFSRWGDDTFTPQRTVDQTTTALEVGFDAAYFVGEHFVDRAGRRVDPSRIDSVTLTSTLGTRNKFPSGMPRWLIGARVARRLNGLEPTRIKYSIESVVVDGANVVHRAQQKFFPAATRAVRVHLLLYSARIRARDVLFHRPSGTALVLTYPDGHRRTISFDGAREIYLPSLARGTYGLKVMAHGYAPAVPLAVSKDQNVTLKVVSYLDILVVGSGLGGLAVGLVLMRRPRLRARLRLRGRTAAHAAAVGAAAAALLAHPHGAAAGTISSRAASSPTPVLAYYYIWFDRSSWRRAKRDYPQLGRYSSDDVSVLERHVELAQSAGIDGFLVSWKQTPRLDRRLAKLTAVAAARHFSLGLVYEGLDFHREPLPVARVEADLERFADRYARNPVFKLFGKPLVIWAGTWRFTPGQVAQVAAAVRDRVYLLASEKSVAGYNRLRQTVDGDAYYWSSIDPRVDTGWPAKLAAMAAAVHRRGGLWVAPAAPGFDATLLGGHRVVPRDGGRTLLQEFNAAERSSPDAIGLVSWNEFSENSEVEPTVKLGDASLTALRDILNARFVPGGDFDSSDLPTSKIGYGLPLIVGIGGVLLTGVATAFWRREVRRAFRSS